MTEIVDIQYAEVINKSDVICMKSDDYNIFAVTTTGEVYIHEKTFSCCNAARRLTRRINKVKKINLTYWVYWRTIYGSSAFLEEEINAHFHANSIRSGIMNEEDLDSKVRELL